MSEDPHRRPSRTNPFASPTPHEANPVQRSWDKSENIRDFLKDFKPRCIQPGETPEEAHRYAGMVDLADKLRANFWPEEQGG